MSVISGANGTGLGEPLPGYFRHINTEDSEGLENGAPTPLKGRARCGHPVDWLVIGGAAAFRA